MRSLLTHHVCLAALLQLSLLTGVRAQYGANGQYVTTPCSMLVAVNNYRAKLGRAPLVLDRRLVAAAQAHSNDMAATDLMQHDSSDGTFWGDRVASYLPNWSYLAENVAEYSTNQSQIMDAWIASYEHELNLKDARAVYIGSGYINSFWTQDFGATMSGDIPFPIDCTKEDGFAWPQPANPGSPFVGSLVTYEGLCLDSVAGLGGLVQANLCVLGSSTQSWTLKQQGPGFYAQATGTNLCVDIFGASQVNGASVGIWTCTGSLNQNFMQNANNSWMPLHSGKCLELPVAGITHKPGTNPDQWTCNGGRNQIIFANAPVSGVTQPYNFVGKLVTTEGLCLDGVNGLGGTLVTAACNGTSTTQKWTLTQRGSYFSIQVTGTTNCVDVFNQSTQSNAKIGIWTCNSGLNQAWSRNANGGFLNLNSGKCMQMPNNGTNSAGAAPLQQPCANWISQVFKQV